MTTGTSSHSPTPPPVQKGAARKNSKSKIVEYERYIDEAVERTRSHVRMVDLAGAFMSILFVTIAFLMLVVLVDHWIMPLGVVGRFIAFGFVVAITLFMGVVMLGPPLLRRINPVYAAHSIEQTTPSLKNSLVDLLLFRSNRTGVHASIFQALEANTARQLSSAPIDAAVDRSRLIKIGYALIALLALLAIYAGFSDKSPLTSLARIVAPWSDIAPPSRVTISDVEPGDALVFVGDKVEISARVLGTEEKELVTIYYSTADRKIVDRPLAMHADGGATWRATLPDSSSGVQQDISYYLSAGDMQTETFHLKVEQAPTIYVESIDYRFPSYTGRSPLTVTEIADIKALEGTRVTIHARSNREMGRAFLEFDVGEDRAEGASNAPTMLPMVCQGKEASVSFTLQMRPDMRGPLHRNYQLRFTTPENQPSQKNVNHAINVIRDLPPEVAILRPEQREIHIAENDYFLIEIEARDPDYGIRQLLLRGESEGRSLEDRLLLDEAEGRQGRVAEQALFVPRDLNLRAGDIASFWGVAEDNRSVGEQSEAAPNVSRTLEYRVIIDPPLPEDQVEQPPEDQSQDSNSEQDQEGGGESEQAEGETSRGGEGGTGSESDSEAESESSEGSEGEASEEGEGESGERSEGEAAEGSEDESTGAENSQEPENGENGANEQTGENGAGGQGSENDSPNAQEEPYDTEGADDGDILEKAANRARQKEEEEAQREQGNQQQGEGTQNEDNPESNQGAGEREEENPGSENETEQGGEGSNEEGSRVEESSREEGAEGEERAENESSAENNSPQSEQEGESGEPGSESENGAESNQGEEGNSPEEGAQPRREEEENNAEGENSGDPSSENDASQEHDQQEGEEGSEQGAGQGDNGNSGAGESNADETGAPMSQDEGEQQQNEEGEGTSSEEEGGAESPSTNDQDSNSESSEGGVRDGGGEEGGGQGANEEGHDSSGQNSPSDEGNAGSDQQGKGDQGEGAGNQEEAEGETGEQGEGEGNGSENGSDPGSSPGESGAEESGDGETPPSEQASEGGSSSGAPTAGGGESSSQEPTDQGPSGPVEESEANLDYAREQTDLALKYIEEADERELEDLLNWNDAQRQTFLDRWRAMQESSDQNEESAEEFNEVLRSLGLRREGATLRGGESEQESRGGVIESARESQPPAEYRELYDAFRRSGGE